MSRKRRSAVVDTNVLIQANEKNPANIQCAASCASRLNEIRKSGVLAVDKEGLIISEYQRHCSFAGQPGAGDAFFKWLTDNRYRKDLVCEVELARDENRNGEFSTFPKDPQLSGFDQADRKFVATALAHPEQPPILNATDSDWWHFREVLNRLGLRVEFICGTQRFTNTTG